MGHYLEVLRWCSNDARDKQLNLRKRRDPIDQMGKTELEVIVALRFPVVHSQAMRESGEEVIGLLVDSILQENYMPFYDLCCRQCCVVERNKESFRLN